MSSYNPIVIDWNSFKLKYFNQNTIYWMEDEDYFYFYTYDGPFIIKCVLGKKDPQDDIMFKERMINYSDQNWQRIMSIGDIEKPVQEEEVSEELSDDAIRDEEKIDKEIIDEAIKADDEELE